MLLKCHHVFSPCAGTQNYGRLTKWWRFLFNILKMIVKTNESIKELTNVPKVPSWWQGHQMSFGMVKKTWILVFNYCFPCELDP